MKSEDLTLELQMLADPTMFLPPNRKERSERR
jgi:hypothetical protein